MLSPREERDIERLATRIADELHTTLRLSHVLRACLLILHHAEAQILARAKDTRLARPPNELADVLGEFESRLARMLLVAIKESPRM